ncbi:MAG: hypothetical protein WCG27_01155, partial [Pseudomonadota bacterium]
MLPKKDNLLVKFPGQLTLIPTPLDPQTPLEPVALGLLQTATSVEKEKSIIAVEEHKPARQRWIHWGLPREAIDTFVLYNEHNAPQSAQELLPKLQEGH